MAVSAPLNYMQTRAQPKTNELPAIWHTEAAFAISRSAAVKQTEGTLAIGNIWCSINGQRAVKLTQITDSRAQFRAGVIPTAAV